MTSTAGGSVHLHHRSSNGFSTTTRAPLSRHNEMDFQKMFSAMEKGHKVCKIAVLKKWDPAYKQLTLDRNSRQIFLTKLELSAVR